MEPHFLILNFSLYNKDGVIQRYSWMKPFAFRFLILIILQFFVLWNVLALHTTDTIQVYFSFDLHNLDKNSQKILDEYLKNISQKDSVNIHVLGYTDKKGNDAYNLNLSQQRANEVKQYLLVHDVKPEWIADCKGFGKTDIREVYPSRMTDSLCRKVVLYIERVYFRMKIPQTVVLKKEDFREGNTLTLQNINFIPGKALLLPESMNVLAQLLKILTDNPGMEIEIRGHVCCIEDDGVDFETMQRNLSVMRAKKIYDYLIMNGIDAKRLQYHGYGGTQKLIQPEMTEDDRIKNRRVDIRIIKI